MKGTVRVYQGYDDKPILEESNMIVDGFKEHIVDMMTRIPAPANLLSDVSSTYNASNFTVQAMSVAPNYSNFGRINSLKTASGLVYDGGAATFSGLSPEDGTSWVYREDVNNYNFTSVNWSSVGSTNSVLQNPVFSSVTPQTRNNRFKDFTLDKSTSAFYINEALSLYELPYWQIQSWLRHDPIEDQFDNTRKAGSCSRYFMTDSIPGVSSVYSTVSGYTEKDEGILYIRSFAPASTGSDSSGAVVLSQNFQVYDSSMDPWVTKIDTASLVPEISFQFSSENGAAGAEIHVVLEDVTDGEFYNFDTNAPYDRHSWGGDGTPYVINAATGASGTVSKFFNVPHSKLKNQFKVSFKFFCETLSDNLRCYFWNAGVNTLDNWHTGNIHKYSDISRYKGNDFTSPAVTITLSGEGSLPSQTDLSNVTYLSQTVTLDPTKQYSYNVFPSYASAGEFRAALIKRFSSNVEDIGQYNLLNAISASSLSETKLTNGLYAISPEIPRTAVYDTEHPADEQVMPYDLCLEVSSSISGSVEVDLTQEMILKATGLNEFNSGLSAVPAAITLETSAYDASGNRRKFNFTTGTWDVSGQDTTLILSSFGDFKFTNISSRGIAALPLVAAGVTTNSNNKFDLILTVSSTGDHPSYVKNIRLNSLAKDISEETQELYQFSEATVLSSLWSRAGYSGQNIFSGQADNKVAPVVSPFASINTVGAKNIQGMYAASASTHARDSVYEAFIMHSAAGDGQQVTLNGAYLTDTALLLSPSATPEQFTSESYFRTAQRNVSEYPYTTVSQGSSLYPTDFEVNPSVSLVNSPNPAAVIPGYSFVKRSGLVFSRALGASADCPGEVSLKYSESFSSLTADAVGFSFEYGIFNSTPQFSVGWRASAKTQGATVWWDTTSETWEASEVGSEPINSFADSLTTVLEGEARFNRTPKIQVNNHDFDETTVITYEIVFYDATADINYFYIDNWRLYNVTSEPDADLGVFPEPDDVTVQPIQSPAGLLGQFTNQIQYNSDLTGVSTERALGSANWAPRPDTSAIHLPDGTQLYDTHNQGACVNTDGFIYYGYEGLSGNLALSGFYTSSTSTSVTYIVDFSGPSVSAFDAQGGIGAIGLWAFDVDATFKKLIENGHDASAVYDKTSPWSGGLYTLSDTTRNPVFRLLSKKVFRQPIIINPTAPNAVIRIVWEINFL